MTNRPAGWLVAVAAGGAIGALARYGALGITGPSRDVAMLFLVNAVGSLIIGVLVSRGVRSFVNLWAFAAIGFCGGFTSFSTYALDVAHVLRGDSTAGASAWLVATPLVAVAAVMAGRRIGATLS